MGTIKTLDDLQQHCLNQINRRQYKINEHQLILDLIEGFRLLRITCTLRCLNFKKCTCKKPSDITPQKIVNCSKEYDKWLNEKIG